MQTDTQKYNETVTPNSRELEILKKYFLQCFSKLETDENGTVIKEHFDTEKLAELLNKDEVDIKKEGFTLNFLGKSYARLSGKSGQRNGDCAGRTERRNKQRKCLHCRRQFGCPAAPEIFLRRKNQMHLH